MIAKEVHQIELEDIKELLGTASESRTLEFKATLPGKADDDTVPFLAGVSSFANSAGGDFVLGVTAKDGIPIAIPGIEIANLDAEKLRLEQLLSNGLEPRLQRVEIRTVPCEQGRLVIVLRVPRSWAGPHRVKKNNQFYARNSAGRYPLDVAELRSAFALSEATIQRIRSFRAERLAKIISGEVLINPPAAAALHLVPLSAFVDQRLIDIVGQTAKRHDMLLPLDGPSGLNQMSVNLDGLMTFSSSPSGGIASYAQLFRTGAIEGVSSLGVDERGTRYFVGSKVANTVVAALRNYVRVATSIEVGFPLFAGLSLCGAKGLHMRYVGPDRLWYHAPALSTEVISLPEIAIESADADVAALMRPIFDIIWNAFGFMRSDMYSETGTWLGS